jgi:uracil phosphoribosyltransferase
MKTDSSFPLRGRRPNLQVSNHPLVMDKLRKLRDKNSTSSEFRRLLEETSMLLFYEAASDFEMEQQEVETPLEKTAGIKFKRDVLLVPILRAGLGMMNGIFKIMPEVRVGMIGVYRDENNFKPVDYYNNLLENLDRFETILLDPMLATSGSSNFAIERIKEKGAQNIRMIFIISSPEGVEALHKAHPDIKIYTAALDRQLNDQAFILPGLGDAGDRYFGN